MSTNSITGAPTDISSPETTQALRWRNTLFLENECLLAATEISVYCDTHSQEFGIINKAEIDVFLELSRFFDDPMDVDN